MVDGYIRLSRKFFKNAYWSQKRTFSLSEAWLDLIQAARFDAEPAIKILPSGRQIIIERGEIHSSLRFLSERWGWSVEKTSRYINRHIENNEIKRRTEHGESILKLCNYDAYNPLLNTDPHTEQNTDPHTDRTPTSTNNNKDKEREERKRKIEEAKASALQRRDLFLDSLIPYMQRYGEKMIDAFFNHWGEMDRQQTKMRFEKQPTWELSKRLATWARRDIEFGSKGQTAGQTEEKTIFS